MATGTHGGAMNKHNAYQNTKHHAKYEKQRSRTAANKQRHIEAQKHFEQKCAEKKGIGR